MGDLGGTGHPGHQAVARLRRHVPQEMQRVLGGSVGMGGRDYRGHFLLYSGVMCLL